MAMYTLAVVPLVRSISTRGESQVWFADDASAGGRLLALRLWWDALVQQGPFYGYFPNARKTWLLVTPEQLKDAVAVFVNTGVQITAEGRLCLGVPLGQPSFVEGRVDVMVKSWVHARNCMSALPSFRSVIHKLHTQRSRMVWLVAGCMLHEQSMTWSQASPPLTRPFDRLVPAMLGRLASSDLQWDLLTLPTRLGGLGLPSVKAAVSR